MIGDALELSSEEEITETVRSSQGEETHYSRLKLGIAMVKGWGRGASSHYGLELI